MPEKQLNHFIPRFMLNYWGKKNEQDRFGVHVYDIERSKFFFSDGTGKKAYSFAIEKNGYVPIIDEERRTNLEDWFSGLEGTLAKAIRQFNAEEISMFDDVKEYQRFLLSVLSFKYRTQAFVNHVTEFLKESIGVREDLDPAKSLEVIVLENIVNATTDDVNTYNFCDFEILHTQDDDSFILGDRPFVSDLFDEWSLLILSNKLVVMLRKNHRHEPRFRFVPAKKDFVHSVNMLIAEQAHYWIVGASEQHLGLYLNEADQKSNIPISYVPPKNLSSGYYF